MDFKPIIDNPKHHGCPPLPGRPDGGEKMKPMRLHHVGIVLPTLEKAHEFMQNNGLEIDYAGYVDAYQADLIFTKFGELPARLK